MIIPLDWMPPIMFGGLVVFMIIGFPVAFSLAAVGFFLRLPGDRFRLFHAAVHAGHPGSRVRQHPVQRAAARDPVLHLHGRDPREMRAGRGHAGIDGPAVRPVRGGLGYSTIIVGFILGAITGTVAAQVIAMAMITLPVMIRHRYDMRYATGVLAASGTITQLVPPSLVLIVLADQLGRSVGDMYLGAWGPSLLQIALFAGYTAYLSWAKPSAVPAVPRTLRGKALLIKCAWGIIPRRC